MTDIVERLRAAGNNRVIPGHSKRALCAEAADEITRLRQCLRWQDDRDGRIDTHSAECYKFGHRHYECALAEIERLRKERDDYCMAAGAEATLGDEARQECKALRLAIADTLEENGHLADGDDCTLRLLVRAMATQTADS